MSRGYITRFMAVMVAVLVLVMSMPQLSVRAAVLLSDMGEGADIEYAKWYYYNDPSNPNLHCDFDTSRIEGIFERWDNELVSSNDNVSGRDDCIHVAIYYGYQGWGSSDSSTVYWEGESVSLFDFSDLGASNKYGIVLHNNGIFLVYPEQTSISYFVCSSQKIVTGTDDAIVHDYDLFDNAACTSNSSFPVYSYSFNGVTLYGYLLSPGTFNSTINEGTILNTDLPVFSDGNDYMSYYNTGDMSGAVRKPDNSELTYVYDNSIGFDTNACVMQRVTLDCYGPQNVRVDYSLTQSTADFIFRSTNQWYIDCVFNFSAHCTRENSQSYSYYFLTPSDDSITIRVPIQKNKTGSLSFCVPAMLLADNGMTDNSGCFVIGRTIGSGFTYPPSIVFASGLMRMYGNVSEYDFFSKAGRLGIWGKPITLLGDIYENFVGKLTDTSSKIYLNDFSITADFYITDGVTRGSVGHGTLDLLNGFYSGYTSAVDDSGAAVMDGVLDFSGRNEYVWDNSSGDSYYYDYSNHTVVNDSTPSLNFSNNIAMTHSFASPLHLFVDNAAELAPTILVNNYPSSGGSSGGSSGDVLDITIEDDDYKHDTLVDYMKHGFELFDNTDTGEKGDGLMAGAAALFGMLGEDMAAMLGFGVGSVVVINILRSLIKR